MQHIHLILFSDFEDPDSQASCSKLDEISRTAFPHRTIPRPSNFLPHQRPYPTPAFLPQACRQGYHTQLCPGNTLTNTYARRARATATATAAAAPNTPRAAMAAPESACPPLSAEPSTLAARRARPLSTVKQTSDTGPKVKSQTGHA